MWHCEKGSLSFSDLLVHGVSAYRLCRSYHRFASPFTFDNSVILNDHFMKFPRKDWNERESLQVPQKRKVLEFTLLRHETDSLYLQKYGKENLFCVRFPIAFLTKLLKAGSLF